jgi:DNA-binding phage protein
MKKMSAYDEELTTALRDPEEAAAYLNAALGDSNQEVFLLALRDVIAARATSGARHQELRFLN